MIINKLFLLMACTACAALNPILIKGSKFFDSVTGQQFFIKGVAYQPSSAGNSEVQDALADATVCQRDSALLQGLGVNMIRVYETYPTNDHSACMGQFEQAGIYVGLDLPSSNFSISRSSPSYDQDILDYFKAKIDAFSGFSNTLMFLAGNEVTNDAKTTPASAYVKASLRDAKDYMKTKSRAIPIGYADNDDRDIRSNVQDYFNCGSDSDRADFYGINIYSWCGDSTYQESGYDVLTQQLANYSIPSFLSETGCNKVQPRTFSDLPVLYSDPMDGVMSGGVVYEYTQEANNYGLVKVNADGSVTKLPDYGTVKDIYSQLKTQGTTKDSYNPDNQLPRKCPGVSTDWQASEKLPPTPSDEACQCILNSLSCQLNPSATTPEDGKNIEAQLNVICGNGLCGDISSDATKGVYGLYSTCKASIKSSIAFNAAVKAGATCDFNGLGRTNSQVTTTASQCQKVAEVANVDNKQPSKGSNANRVQHYALVQLIILLQLI